MFTRNTVKPGNIITNGWIHPGQRRKLEIVAKTPRGYLLYDHAAGTLGLDPLTHPGWVVIRETPIEGDQS